MEGPLLTKSEHNVEDVTIHGDSSSNDEHIIDITINGGSSSADHEQTPHEAFQWSCPFTSGSFWILVELAVTLVQIVAAIFFLILTKDERDPELDVALFIWIIFYTCASIATLPFVCCRLWQYIQNASSETSNEVMDRLEIFLESFFVSLIVVSLWHILTESSSRQDTSRHFWLWLGLLAFSCIRYVLPNFQFTVQLFMLPGVSLVTALVAAIVTMINSLLSLFLVIIGLFALTFSWIIGMCG
ncbi:hypothetical protein AtEden1_Chr1g0017051 [Arabidopsis thaliana]